MAVPRAARQFVELLPVAFVPSIHVVTHFAFLDAEKARQGLASSLNRMFFPHQIGCELYLL